ncbi:hypothetical protein [Spiroplasma endosymbiont of Clivina fossor]|uniref:hypothetical protein n=1 Tax=Spiroplasma endosymbiont of Clivina fossor TaxID=3066282 RepID=UPI00313E76DC
MLRLTVVLTNLRKTLNINDECFKEKGGDYMIGTFLADAPATAEKITANDAMTKLWNAIMTAFTKMWDIIAVNMPQVGNFFADYWIFIFPFILAIFFICFKMFEKLLGAVR